VLVAPTQLFDKADTEIKVYTTYCPEATTFTQGTKTYTATASETITITGKPLHHRNFKRLLTCHRLPMHLLSHRSMEQANHNTSCSSSVLCQTSSSVQWHLGSSRLDHYDRDCLIVHDLLPGPYHCCSRQQDVHRHLGYDSYHHRMPMHANQDLPCYGFNCHHFLSHYCKTTDIFITSHTNSLPVLPSANCDHLPRHNLHSDCSGHCDRPDRLLHDLPNHFWYLCSSSLHSRRHWSCSHHYRYQHTRVSSISPICLGPSFCWRRQQG
jgi:hypothetical protein